MKAIILSDMDKLLSPIEQAQKSKENKESV